MTAWNGIVGRSVDLLEFKDHVDRLKFNGWTPSFTVVHNTSAPDAALYREWHRRSNWSDAQWMLNLQSYYRGLGWRGCPHAFVAEDKIHLMNPLTMPGTHTPSWNSRTWGIETVAEFDREPFSAGVRDNLIGVLGILCARVGHDPVDYKLGVRGLHFHKEDAGTTHRDCPGKNLVKAQLVADVAEYIRGMNGDGHAHIPPAVHEAPTAALTAEQMTSVIWLQAGLNRLGTAPALSADGKLGPVTKAAVTVFQAKHGLVADGIAGPVTRLAIATAIDALA